MVRSPFCALDILPPPQLHLDDSVFIEFMERPNKQEYR
jgi:hypothetical protein